MKSAKILISSTMMICLLSCAGYCSSTKPNDEKTEPPAISATAIRKGWTAPGAGYYLTPAAMRETVEGWQTSKAQAEERATALEQMKQLNDSLTESNARTLAELKAEIADERKQHARALRSKKRGGLIWGLVIGGVAGVMIEKNK